MILTLGLIVSVLNNLNILLLMILLNRHLVSVKVNNFVCPFQLVLADNVLVAKEENRCCMVYNILV